MKPKHSPIVNVKGKKSERPSNNRSFTLFVIVLFALIIIIPIIIIFPRSYVFTLNNYEVLTVERSSINDVVRIPGTLTAANSVSIVSPEQGSLAYMSVKEGDFVFTGQILGKLVLPEAQKILQEAEGNYKVSQGNLYAIRVNNKINAARAIMEKTEAETLLNQYKREIENMKRLFEVGGVSRNDYYASKDKFQEAQRKVLY